MTTTPEQRKAHAEALLNDPNSTDPQVRQIHSLLGATARITCMNCGATLTPGGPACCPQPRTTTDPDLTTLVDAVAADVWEQQKDTLWADVPPALQHSTREFVLPFVVATLRHLDDKGVAR